MSPINKNSLIFVLLLLVFAAQATAQALPTNEITYFPFQEAGGNKFVVVKWKADSKAIQSRLIANYLNPNTNANVPINNDNLTPTPTPITQTNPTTGNLETIGKEFTVRIPFGVEKLITENAPNFLFQVLPFGNSLPPANTKNTGSILINMDFVRDYFKLKSDLALQISLLDSKSTELNTANTKIETLNGNINSKDTTIKKQSEIIENLGKNGIAKFDIVDVTDITHKSVKVTVKSTSDLPVRIKATAFLGSDTNVETPINDITDEPEFIKPNETLTFKISNIPSNQNFYIAVKEVIPPTNSPEAKQPVVKKISSINNLSRFTTKTIPSDYQPVFEFMDTPQTINNEKISVKVRLRNISNYNVEIKAKDEETGEFNKSLFKFESKESIDGTSTVEIPIKAFKLLQGKEYRLTGKGFSKFPDVDPTAERNSTPFSGLGEKLFNDFAVGVNKDGLELRVLAVQESNAKFTLSVDINGVKTIQNVVCQIAQEGNDRSCKLNFAGVVDLVRSLNLNNNEVKATQVTFAAKAEAGDKSKRELHF
jgi:hypothetical protein